MEKSNKNKTIYLNQESWTVLFRAFLFVSALALAFAFSFGSAFALALALPFGFAFSVSFWSQRQLGVSQAGKKKANKTSTNTKLVMPVA